MQILNISVMNRPAKSLTSLMYLPEVIEKISSDWECVTMRLRTIMNETNLDENFKTSYDVTRMVLRDTRVDVTPPLETLGATYGVSTMKLRDTLVSQKTPLEELSANYGITKMSLRSALVSTNVPPDDITASFGVVTMKLG